VVENFRCTERPGPYRGGKGRPGSYGNRGPEASASPAWWMIRLWAREPKLSCFGTYPDTIGRTADVFAHRALNRDSTMHSTQSKLRAMQRGKVSHDYTQSDDSTW